MENERKTLDDRAKMTDLERIRHSCAHVLATAILRLWPDAQFAYGPPVENGFYYDVELSHRIAPEDFEKLEAEMKKETKANNTFEKLVVTREQAIADAESGRLGGLSAGGLPVSAWDRALTYFHVGRANMKMDAVNKLMLVVITLKVPARARPSEAPPGAGSTLAL